MLKRFVFLLLVFQLFGCANVNVGYWEFKVIEKSIDAITSIFKSEKKIPSPKIEIPLTPSPPLIKSNIAVIELSGVNIPKSAISALSDRLRSELLQTNHFQVIERDVMDEILKEQGFQQSGCTSNECAVEIGRLMDVENIIGGSINKVGNTFASTIRMINSRNGNIEKTVSFDYSGPVDEILKRGMKKIAVELTF